MASHKTAAHKSPASPSIDDLVARIHFDAREGRIWLDEQRMLLMHVSG